MVEFIDWEPHYLRILRSFHYSRKEDEASARLLSETLPIPRLSINSLEDMIWGRTAVIFGAHEKVKDDFRELNIEERDDDVFIAADGACSAMREMGIRPDIIVSDLDGAPEDLLHWNRSGVPLIVHAHGDNMDRITDIGPQLSSSMATTQSTPFDDVHNFGGFTDGDRCVFLADHFGAIRIILVGFDFDTVGKYSFSANEDQKLRKLKWARELLSLFQLEYAVQEKL